jgi:hypothetical protein
VCKEEASGERRSGSGENDDDKNPIAPLAAVVELGFDAAAKLA